MNTIVLSLTSGLLAACGSLFGKLSSSPTPFFDIFANRDPDWIETLEENELIPLTIRILFFIAMITCNTLMWLLFTRALNQSETTVQVTILNTAANFLSTALFGHALFNEYLSLRWWMGVGFICIGIALLNNDTSHPETKKSTKDLKSH